MPRFNPNKYDPKKESSKGVSLKPNEIALRITLREDESPGCLCGCGDIPGKGSKFMMGHDARLRGRLIRAHLTDHFVRRIYSDGQESTISAFDWAKELGWEQYLKEAEARREGKNREVLARAVGSKRLFKVGRWQQTGQVMAVYETPEGNDYELEYVTKTGEKKTARVPARKTEAAPAGS